MPIEDICAQVEKLTPKPGDIITVTLFQNPSNFEIDTVLAALRPILPDGCNVLILTSNVTLTLTRGEDPT